MERAHIKGQLQGLRAALRQQPGRRPSSPGRPQSPARPSPAPVNRAPAAAAPGSGGPRSRPKDKSDCVTRVEEMKKQREERRRRAEEAKNKRAEEAKEAESRGGIESVDFLRKIREYRQAHGLSETPEPWEGSDIWDIGGASDTSRIRVCVRKRPMLRVEQIAHDFDVISSEAGHSSLVVHEPRTKVDMSKAVENHRFVFDAVFNEADSNETIHITALRPMLQHVFSGGAATIFAFGQTGSGKTCTMAGHGNLTLNDGNANGLYALAAQDVVDTAQANRLIVGISFFEVYRGQILDLLGDRAKLEVLEDGKGRVQVVGLREFAIESAEELLTLVKQAEELRAVGATSANEQSSRSHAILQVLIRDESGRGVGKLSLVDLAGSERAADSSSKDRQTRIEGAEINKSLLCLKECIRSLDADSTHIPFRGSKLTQVLRDSFVGRAKTTMIATISPGSSSAENTLNTLRYAQRVKEFSVKRPPAALAAAKRPSALPPPAPPVAPPAPQPMPPASAAARGAHYGAPLQALPTGPNGQPLQMVRQSTAEELVAAKEQTSERGDAGADCDPSDDVDELRAIEDLQKSMKRDGAEEVGSFFKSVAAVTRSEQHLVAAHKESIEANEQLIAQEKMLIEELQEADGCSLDEYATALEKVLLEKYKLCHRVQARLDALKKQLEDEEALSARVKQVPIY